MNPLIQLKTTPPLLIALALLGFALLPKAQAVVPPPDGGYPGGNTAEGQNALFSLTTGGFNTAVGYLSLRSDTTGSFNTALGAGTLLANTADQNTAIGTGALLSNTTGSGNTANGTFALADNTEGYSNTAVGSQALLNNTTGFTNTACGIGALMSNTSGSNNTAIGQSALANNNGGGNIAVGAAAGWLVIAGFNNIHIGHTGLQSDVRTIRIGTPFDGINGQNATFIAGILDGSFIGSPVVVNSSSQLGVATSSRRYKKEIKAMDKASEAILALKPVTFCYKSDPKNTPCFGLVAEDVAKVNPDLVIRDKNGEIYSVRYDAVNAMLLNEFLKEHKKVEKQEATITRLTNDFQTVSAQQRNEIQLLSAQLKEQAAQIHKVSAQVEMNRTAPQVVVSNQ